MTPSFDLAVVGAGFAGSLTALIARRLGLSVALIERGRHPRFAIGESSSPLANLLLEELADRYALPRIRPLAAWGSWRRDYPGIGCGLKRGFTFYAHARGKPFAADPERRDQLLVAASPCDEVADTHWYRPDFDAFLAREAETAGAAYSDQTELSVAARGGGGGGATLEARRGNARWTLSARLVVDASGPGGFLHRAFELPAARFAGLPDTESLYAHLTGVRRLDALPIFRSEEPPPYPVDDAAVHHVFEGGWIWVLRFGNGIVSAGVAATPVLARELRLDEGEAAWHRLLALLPTVAEQFTGAEAATRWRHRRPMPFRTGAAAGPGWTMLPSAAAFVDPLLSTGFPLTLLGIERLASALRDDWGTPAFDARLQADAATTLAEADTAAALVAALYAHFGDFEVFAALTQLYFAAASYAEAARRLGRRELSGSFLSGTHPVFGPAFAACTRLAFARDPARRRELLDAIARAVEPLDVIGLSDLSRRNWYPVLSEDLLAARRKLGATREEIEAMLRATMPAAPVTSGDGASRALTPSR
ncbi:MAG TPA: FAD-dependent oxidoreductase [Thermoanaerobaculia bacterium]|nr:FAD-dependent oxidoreductase [Thermoanaerobaculia bacterium]